MLFSNPDYPVFLIAVFFLYVLPRAGVDVLAFVPRRFRAALELFRAVFGRWARGAAMLVLGDLIFLLVSKDTNTLWDPLGGTLLRLAQYGGRGPAPDWPASLAWHWALGTAVLTEIISVEHAAAVRNHVAFFDTFAAMGGGDHMDGWVNADPKIAYKDRVHFTDIGYQMWADALSGALLEQYERWREANHLPPSGPVSVPPAKATGAPLPGPIAP